MADATIKAVADFFRGEGEGISKFQKEWKELTDEDKAQIKAGIGNGSMTY